MHPNLSQFWKDVEAQYPALLHMATIHCRFVPTYIPAECLLDTLYHHARYGTETGDNLCRILYRPMQQRVVDHKRKKQLASLESLIEDGVTLQEPFPADFIKTISIRDEANSIARNIESLPLAQRESMRLRYLCDYDIIEVARKLRKPYATIKSRIERGRRLINGGLIINPTRVPKKYRVPVTE